MRGIHRWPVDSPHKGSVRRGLDDSFAVSLKRLLDKPPNWWWFETPWTSYQIRKIAGCACTGNAGNVSPGHRRLAIPTCITVRAWRTCCCCCCSANAQIVRVAHSWVRSSCCLDGFSLVDFLLWLFLLRFLLVYRRLLSIHLHTLILWPFCLPFGRFGGYVLGFRRFLSRICRLSLAHWIFLWLVFTDSIEALVLIIALHWFLVSLFM